MQFKGRERDLVSKHNNNGVFDKIRQAVATSHAKDPLTSKSKASSQDIFTASEDLNTCYQQQLETAKQQLNQELETKYRQLSQTYVQEQEAKLKHAFKQEKEQYEKFVKEKYEHIARAALREREQQLLKQVQQKITKVKNQEAEQIQHTQRQQQLSTAEWQLKLNGLQQELQQQQIRNKLEIELNVAQFAKEQEQALRAELTYTLEQKYTKQLEAQQKIAAQETAQQIANAVEAKEQELKQRYAAEIASHEQLIQARHEQEIDLAVRTALNEKEQQVSAQFKQLEAEHADKIQAVNLALSATLHEKEQQHNAQLTQDQAAYADQLQAVSLAATEAANERANQENVKKQQTDAHIKELHAQYADQIQLLTLSNNAKLAELQAELLRAADTYELSTHEFKAKLERELSAKYAEEYAVKLEQEKSAILSAKNLELQQQLTEQRKIIGLQLEEENNIVIKYKERQETQRIQLELEDKARADRALSHQALIVEFENKRANDRVALEAEYIAKYTELHKYSEQQIQEAKITADSSSKQQAILSDRLESLKSEVEQARNAITMQHTDETKILLQQQQKVLLDQFTQDLNSKLALMAEQKNLEQKQALANLEQELRAEYAGRNTYTNTQRSEREQNILLQQQQLLEQQAQALNVQHEREKIAALHYLEEKLKAEFAMQIASQQQYWQQEQNVKNIKTTVSEQSIEQVQPQNVELQNILQIERIQIEQKVRDELAQQVTHLEDAYENEKQVALEKLRIELSAKHSIELQKLHANSSYEKIIDLQNTNRQERNNLEQELAVKILQREAELQIEFQVKLAEQRKQITAEMNSNLNLQVNEQIHHTIEAYKQKIAEEFQTMQANELELAQDQLKEQYAIKLQQHIEIMRLELDQEKAQHNAEYKNKLDSARQEIKTQLLIDLEHKFEQRFVQESKKLNIKLAQEREILTKEITVTMNKDKESAIAEHESNLRDSLYKEMVKQKEYIQAKSAAAQENALQELKRRLESQHKQEVERVKQGFFEVNDRKDYSHTVAKSTTRQANYAADRGVEQLAERILSKFSAKRDD